MIRRLVCSSISSVPDAIGLRMNFCAPASKNLLDSSMMSSLSPTAISSLGSFLRRLLSRSFCRLTISSSGLPKRKAKPAPK